MSQGLDVRFVMMPYADSPRPSLALGLLQAALKREGIRCKTTYANLRFAELLGWGLPDASHLERLLGEWTFSRAAFREDAPAPNLPEGLYRGNFLPPGVYGENTLRETLICVREEIAPHFVDELAKDLLSDSPRIVGCSSTFEQHCASLALLRRVKELDPSVITLMGGANCEAEMGLQTVRSFPWVDFVVSGEADEIIAPLCQALLRDGINVDRAELPLGVLHAKDKKPASGMPVPRAVIRDLDNLPVPDYSDYFSDLAGSSLKDKLRPGLLVETSRGCWWGQKHHCTFCGLNGGGMIYRSKDAERAIAELDELAEAYDTYRFMVVDNILDQKYFRTLLPMLAERDAPFELFFETKANLRQDQVELLRDSGVIWIQPGIEAFSDELLSLMNKGTSAMQNVQLLKYTREQGIHTTWLLLHSFPGEDDQVHQEVTDWLPLLFHLQPPRCAAKVLFDRFSVYHQNPEKYGLKLKADTSYRSIYPLSDSELDELAYFFVDQNQKGELGPRAVALSIQTLRWWNLYNRNVNPVLTQNDDGTALAIFDTRPCATKRRHQLVGIDREVYLACEPARSLSGLSAFLERPFDEIEASLERGIAENLILELSGRYLALAIPGDVPAFCQIADFPGGGEKPLEPFTDEALSVFREKMLTRAAEIRRMDRSRT
ncbi:MAG: RiPP maturation radical SAM C-methyltransferase [Myxococcota bacterium]|nr:RiPP maturation radical SAM C-methyltransferase [Myxococcota bacterium]